MTVSRTYASAYTFSSIENSLNFEDIEFELKKLEETLKSFNESKHNVIEFSTDYSDYNTNNTQSLEDNLLDITKDAAVTCYLLDRIEKIIGARKSYFDTETMIKKVSCNSNKNPPYEYFHSLTNTKNNIENDKYAFDYFDVCNLNSSNFKFNITNRNEFTEKAKLTYEHIHFHENFSDKLKTIKRGNFLDYLNEFSHALNVLNHAYFKISIDENKNEQDLIIIEEISKTVSLNGRGLKCDRQGSNKPIFSFPRFNNPLEKEEVNCEYHLKLNHNDTGKKLNYTEYNRAYFGLKYNENTKRKYIKLAYIGEHWPPKNK